MTAKKSSTSTTKKTSTKKTGGQVVGTTTDRDQVAAAKKTGGQVVGATTDRTETAALSGSEVTTLRVSLRHPHKFDDVPAGNGDVKTVILPGLDDSLRGKQNGILTPEGNAVFFQLPRKDWEAIKAMHGQEQMFHSWRGNPPLVAEIESVIAAKSGVYDDEIKATRTGLAPQDPEKVGVVEATGED